MKEKIAQKEKGKDITQMPFPSYIKMEEEI